MKSYLIPIAMAGVLFCATGCKEDIDESNLYASQSQSIEEYLASNPQFSYFNKMLSAVGYDKILRAYGTYTCFAPTNEGIVEYLDSLYDDPVNIENPHNGMTDRAEAWLNSLDQLTGEAKERADSLCLDITLFHLMGSKTIGIEMDNSNTLNTLINRDITSSLGEKGDIVLNGYSHVTRMDVELENGILHEIDHALRRSNALVASELSKHEEFKLFSEAVVLCGLTDTLVKQVREGLIVPAKEYNEYIPKECRLGYTIFAETDEVFANAGITSVEQLIDSVKVWYGNCSEWYDYLRQKGYQVSTGNDYRNPWNALNMFLRYHITEVKVPYNKLFRTRYELPDFVPVEYYETMLPYTLLKVSRQNSKPVVNRWVTNTSLTDGVAVQASAKMAQVVREGLTVSNAGYSCLNGFVHPIDGVLRYDAGVPNGVLNERIRVDDLALFPEMTSNNIRMATDAELRGMNAGIDAQHNSFDGNGSVRVPENFSTHMRVYNGNETKLFYLSGQNFRNWCNYQGDEFNCVGAYDFAIRLLPVPAGMYEVRLGYSSNYKRGMMQVYVGRSSDLTSMVPVDIPLDMRHTPSETASEANPDPYTGWCVWDKCDDQGVETDQNMRYLGFMRAPMGPTVFDVTPMRSHQMALRRIILKQNFEQGEYWIRFKTMLPQTKDSQFHLDYIELCPEQVYNNATYLEDMY